MVVGGGGDRECTKPDVLIPLQYGPSKLLLVGDPKQLPATVISWVKLGRYHLIWEKWGVGGVDSVPSQMC